ncbi:MAG: zinc-ribbon domain-containing protein [Candidatus Thermoplasmatota archaeon]|nr:zinc-ribbon domain-containing protein [Candidatus Thermoplasmatota archaeon]
MYCAVCSEEIPDDSLFCPECGARQDPSKSAAMGGRNFGVVSGQAVQATRDMQDADAAGGTFSGSLPIGSSGDNVLSKIAGQMDGQPSSQPAPVQQPQAQPQPQPGTTENRGYSQTDQIVDRIVDNERQEKEGARNEWLAMNQKTATGVLSSLTGAELPDHLASGGGARFLDDAEDISREKKRAKSNQPSPSLLRRMAEVAVRRVARKRGVAVESPQVALTEEDTIRVNVTYIDDGRVLDTPPDLSNAFEHAIATEMALKGFDIGIEIVLFRSMDGKVEPVWGDVAKEETPEDDEDLFSCEDCGHYPIRESDSSCPGCGAAFVDEDEDFEEQPAALRGPAAGPSDAPPSRGPGGGPPRGPARGPSGAPKGPSRGPSRGGPPSQGPGPSGPSSKGPTGGGPPSRGPGGGPPSRGPGGGPPSKGPSGGPPKKGGGPKGPSGGPKGGPPGRKGPSGPRRGPPR